MAVLLTCKDISLEFPTKQVLQEVTLGIDTGDRIGIVGQNGSGKSTLLRLFAGQISPDSGQIIAKGTPTIGLLQQRDSFSDDEYVDDVLNSANATLDAYSWQADPRAREIVHVLLDGINAKQAIGTLSGGQRRRVDLARLLMGNWDILMLDEPTNHLDIPTINWLANHLKSRWAKENGALLIVTHDRWFLDEVCQRMWEVYEGRVLSFEGGYSAYTMQRVERARLEEVAIRKRNNQLRKELAWLSRGAQARRSKPKFHLEAAQALIADVPPVRDSLKLAAAAMTRLGKQVYELSDVCVDRDGKRVLSNITWTIGPGDRIGILGKNGAGKSTLLQLLEGQIRPTLGHIKVGRTVQIAALSQNLSELAPYEDDVVRVLCGRYKTTYLVDGHNLSPTKLLERMGFTRDELNARVKDLSGGQRRRLQLLLTLLEEPNVLILDEPGNDLDTDMLAATEDLLDSWAGTLLVVSHDRHFLERTCDNLYAILDGRIRHMPGGMDEYLAFENERDQKSGYNKSNSTDASAKRESNATSAEGAAPGNATHNAANSTSSLSNAQRYQMRKQLASLERRMNSQQQRIDDAKAALDAADPYDYEALGNAQNEIALQQSALELLEQEWLELSEKLES